MERSIEYYGDALGLKISLSPGDFGHMLQINNEQMWLTEKAWDQMVKDMQYLREFSD